MLCWEREFLNSEEDVIDNGGQAVMSELKRRGWRYSSDQIQFKNTVQIDLNPSEEEFLARMKQKTRYNIRLAEKKGVSVRVGTKKDLPLLYKMYAETSIRDGFVIRAEGYYKTVWETFMAGERSSIENRKSSMPLTSLSSPKSTTNLSPLSLSFISRDAHIMSMACRAMFTVRRCRLIFCNGKR